MTSLRLDRPWLFLAAWIAAFSLLAITSCDIAQEDGHTYLTFAKDAAWENYDSLEVTWIDTMSGAGGILFQGDPGDLKPKNRVLADGYHGQKILILFKGFNGGVLAFEEHRRFDGTPGGVTTAIIPVIPDGPAGALKSRAPRLSAIQADTLVSIHDFVDYQANALLDSGGLKSFAWDFDADGAAEDSTALTGGSAVLRGRHVFHAAGRYTAVLRVHSADSSGSERVTVEVAKDEPTADAGADLTVYPEDSVALSGMGRDGLGKVVRMEWKIGDAPFSEGDRASFRAPTALGDLVCRFQVTDDDSQSVADEVIIHVVSRTESNLTGIAVSSGTLSPQFNPSTLGYLDTVGYESEAIALTPTGTGEITVNDKPVQSGHASQTIALSVGNNPILVTVKVPGTTGKVYQVNVVRLPPSADANLADLAVSAGVLDSAFRADDTLYTILASNATASTTVTATLADAASSLAINGFLVKSGSVSGSIPLAVGPNSIKLVVTGQSGGSKTYTLNVLRAEDGNADLASLSLSAGPIGPAFSASANEYALSVATDVASTEVTAAPVRSTSSLTIDGRPAQAGKAVVINLGVGGTLIDVAVTAQNGTKKTYSIRVTRAGNGNADLSAIGLSTGDLAPTFTADAVFYTVAVSNGTKTLDITAASAQATSVLEINGSPAVSGKPFPVPLAVGTNTITLAVTAENGDKKSYTVSATRAKNANADLKSLSLSSGTLSPAFAAAASAYAAAVSNPTASVTISLRAAETTSTLSVNGIAIDRDSGAVAVALNVGANVIPIVVTAQSGGAKSYALTVTRAPNANANLSALTSSGGALTPAFDPATAAYALTVSNSVVSTTVIPTAAAATSAIKVNGTAVASGAISGNLALNVGANAITILVTAQDSSTKTYALTVTRAANGNADLSALTASAGALTPAFAAGTFAYTLAVANTVASTTVTPTVATGATSVKINGTAVVSGAASGAIPLIVGANTITVLATAQDNSTRTYTVTVTRAANANADLSGLSLSAGTIAPAFATGTTAYALSVANAVTATTVTPAVATGTTSVKVNGTAVASGAASGSIALGVGTNTITVLATAQNNSTKTYTVTVTRAPNANADLSALAVSSGSLAPAFAAATAAYTLTVPYSTASITATPAAAAGTSAIKVNGTVVASGSASGPIALAVGTTNAAIVVTAENGSTKTYSLAVTRNPGVKIAAGYFHSLVLKADKTLWGAGSNTFGTLGDGVGENRASLIPMASDVIQMSGGYYSSVAVKTGGAVLGTGGNYFGALGIGSEPVKCSSFVDIMTNAVKVASGYSHTLFLKSDGTVWGSGWNYYGTVGIGAVGTEGGGSVTIPVQIMSNVADISAGWSHSLFLRGDGTLWASGQNSDGAFGIGTNEEKVGLPVLIATNVAGMAGGSSFTQILKKDGTLWSAGSNASGQLGDGTLNARNISSQIMTSVSAVACGSAYTLALKTDGTLWAMGSNSKGQLGDGTLVDRSAPVQVMSGVFSIAACGGLSMAVKKDGSVWTWGEDRDGGLADGGSNTERPTPLQILP